MTRISQALKRFRRDETGTYTVEAVLVVPFLAWALLTMLFLSDYIRTHTTAVKASYTVSDAMSRLGTTPVDAEFIEGMHTLYDYLARARFDTDMRVSSVTWSDSDSKYEVIWSHGTETTQELTTADLNQKYAERLPTIPGGDTIILVEFDMEYVPAFNIGQEIQTLTNTVITRPRFAPQLRFDNGEEIIFMPEGGGTCDDGSDLCS